MISTISVSETISVRVRDRLRLQNTGRPLHLEGVLGHARQAVVGGAGGNGANAEFSDLVRLAEQGDALGPHHAHQAWEDEGGKEEKEQMQD